jgi:outer membrane protein assembly factor BamB
MEMGSKTSTRPWIAVLLSVLIPPLGIVLLWARTRIGIPMKVFSSLGLIGLAAVYLIVFFGLRAEVDGSGTWPIFYFGTREAHYVELEEDRKDEAELPSLVVPTQSLPTVEAKPVPTSTTAPPAYWTDYRGPNRDGHYKEMAILTKWPDRGLPELWRRPVGGGYASLVVAEGKAFTIEQRKDHEVVAAYDMETGREVWTNSWRAHFQESMGGPGPRATPAWHGGKVYALGAEGELRCLDAASGKPVWSRNILKDNRASNLQWAMAAAPLVVEDKVIVLPGKSVAAYDRLTGQPVWTALDDRQSYTSPMLVTLAGQRQLLIVSARRAMGLTVEDGRLLWEYPWQTSYDINAAQPLVIGENRFYISAGYGHGAAVVEITRNGERFQARTVWENTRMKNKFNSAVLYEGHVYGFDEAILACIDATTGEQKWKGGRYGYGQLLLASGHLIITSETGDVVLVKATPERHQELARFRALDGKTWNTPAIAGGKLLVRNTREMACYRITP